MRFRQEVRGNVFVDGRVRDDPKASGRFGIQPDSSESVILERIPLLPTLVQIFRFRGSNPTRGVGVRKFFLEGKDGGVKEVGPSQGEVLTEQMTVKLPKTYRLYPPFKTTFFSSHTELETPTTHLGGLRRD